jgi:hypothetical protein
MTRRLEQLVAELDHLEPRDFDLNNSDADGMERLYALTDELSESGLVAAAADDLFRFIERISQSPEIDPRYDLGSPGPLVHTLEALPGYEMHLIDSVKRQPTPMTLWMLNRLANTSTDGARRTDWLDLIAASMSHKDASAATIEVARSFLDHHQRGQSNSTVR